MGACVTSAERRLAYFPQNIQRINRGFCKTLRSKIVVPTTIFCYNIGYHDERIIEEPIYTVA